MIYAINNEITKGTRKILKKYSKDIPVDNQNAKGSVSIVRYRKYTYREEVEIEFDGTLKLCVGGKRDWYTSDTVRKIPNVSKIKLNRIIKKCVLDSVNRRCKYFEVDIKHYSYITKVLWK